MAEHNNTETLERHIAQSREALASTLESLQERLALESIAALRDGAGDIGKSIEGKLRANPMATALTGAGLAWLLLGNRSSGTASPAADMASVAGHGAEDWAKRVDQLQRRAAARLHDIEEAAARQADAVRTGVSNGLDDARDFVAEREAVLSDLAEKMNDGLQHGLDNLSGEARDKVAASRELAYAAGQRVRDEAAAKGKQAGTLIGDHPVAAGACAALLGVALAAMLPRKRG